MWWISPLKQATSNHKDVEVGSNQDSTKHQAGGTSSLCSPPYKWVLTPKTTLCVPLLLFQVKTHELSKLLGSSKASSMLS